MENETVIGFIGAGNMAYALINGLLNNDYDSKNIKASDPNDELFVKVVILSSSSLCRNNPLLGSLALIFFES